VPNLGVILNQMPVNKLHFLQNLLALSAVTLVVIILSTDMFLAYQNNLLNKYSGQMPIKTSLNLNNNTKEWKTYSNDEFSFKYPPNWPNPVKNELSTKYELDFDTKMFITSGVFYDQDKQRNLTLEEYINNFKSSPSNYSLDYFHGKRFSYISADKKQEIDIVLSESPTSTNLFIITFRFDPKDDVTKKTADQILSTFKFTDTKTTTTPEAKGQFCGGIAGVACPDGYSCKLDGNYPDAGGTCVKN